MSNPAHKSGWSWIWKWCMHQFALIGTNIPFRSKIGPWIPNNTFPSCTNKNNNFWNTFWDSMLSFKYVILKNCIYFVRTTNLTCLFFLTKLSQINCIDFHKNWSYNISISFFYILFKNLFFINFSSIDFSALQTSSPLEQTKWLKVTKIFPQKANTG